MRLDFVFLQKCQNTMSHNVPAVCDVFLCAIKEMRSISSTQKNVAEQNATKGVSPTGVLRSPSRRKAAKRIQTCYVLVCPLL